MAADSKTTSKTKTKRTRKSPQKAAPELPTRTFSHAFFREAFGLLLFIFSVALFLALISFAKEDFQRIGTPLALANLIGPVGAYVGDALLYVFGVGAFLINGVLFYVSGCLILAKSVTWRAVEITGQLLFVLFGVMFCHLVFADFSLLGHLPGGLLGETTGEISRAFVGFVGAILLSIGGMILALMLATPLSISQVGRWLVARIHRTKEAISHKYQVHMAYREKLAEERLRLQDLSYEMAQAQAIEQAQLEARPIINIDSRYREDIEPEVESKVQRGLAKLVGERLLKRSSVVEDEKVYKSQEVVATDDRPWVMGDEDPTPASVKKSALRNKKADREVKEDHDVEEKDVETEAPNELILSEPGPSSEIVLFEPRGAKSESLVNIDFGPQIIDSAAERKERRRQMLLKEEESSGVLFKPKTAGAFELPAVHFLNFDDQKEPGVDPETLRTMAMQIEQCLADFKVEGSVVEICPGPVITMFEFSPAPGVRVSKIANLSDDLAMALSAYSVRIVAPIPGKGVVGIEVPNPRREMVFLKEIIADEVFSGDQKADLPLALGVDVEGQGVVADLARMPHLLVAGATGSGKSVAVNTMICSLLYKHTPEDVRFIMVDPKMLEFSVYADIPHLLLPVVTDPKKATMALNWAVNEMERRYQALADLGVRNIKGYNKRVKVLTAQAELDQLEGREETEALRSLGIDSNGNPEHTHMPYIVVIIDEFADLMMTAAKDVEQAVARLAQKARAAGIHLILATQRPSTDVITGLIKANFPTRFALRVTSKTDSRVILDGNGAETLLGHGDALFVPPGTSTLTRVHGGYVSEEEISRIVDFLKLQGKPEYNDQILVEEGEEEEDVEEWERDEHYEEAVALVVESRQASISMIQRKLRVGYNRAARMVDMMERENIVSSADGCKPREVLVSVSPY